MTWSLFTIQNLLIVINHAISLWHHSRFAPHRHIKLANVQNTIFLEWIKNVEFIAPCSTKKRVAKRFQQIDTWQHVIKQENSLNINSTLCSVNISEPVLVCSNVTVSIPPLCRLKINEQRVDRKKYKQFVADSQKCAFASLTSHE